MKWHSLWIGALVGASMVSTAAAQMAAPTPALTPDIIAAAEQRVAFAFGLAQLTPDQRIFVEEDLRMTWASGDAARIAEASRLPATLGQFQQAIAAQPQNAELLRQQFRGELMAQAQREPGRPLSQVVNVLAVQAGGPAMTPATPAYAPSQQAPMTPAPAASAPPPQTALNPATAGMAPGAPEDVVNASCQLLAFSFGQSALAPAQSQLVRHELQQIWQRGDVEGMCAAMQLPALAQQIQQTLTYQPGLADQMRAEVRSWFIEAARENPRGPLAQAVTQLGGGRALAGAPAAPGQGTMGWDQAYGTLIMNEDPYARAQREEAQIEQQYYEQDLEYDRLDQQYLEDQQQYQYQQEQYIEQDYSTPDYSYDSYTYE